VFATVLAMPILFLLVHTRMYMHDVILLLDCSSMILILNYGWLVSVVLCCIVCMSPSAVDVLYVYSYGTVNSV